MPCNLISWSATTMVSPSMIPGGPVRGLALTVGTHTPECCVPGNFRFLLDREPRG
jgi:hypothetical protein